MPQFKPPPFEKGDRWSWRFEGSAFSNRNDFASIFELRIQTTRLARNFGFFSAAIYRPWKNVKGVTRP
jgi:hypothetical protein